MEPIIPANALNRQIRAKLGSPRRSNNHSPKRPSTEKPQVKPAASSSSPLRRGSTDHSIKTDVASSASNNPMRTQKSVLCEAIASGFILPNGKTQRWRTTEHEMQAGPATGHPLN
jgi:hypothetical protein